MTAKRGYRGSVENRPHEIFRDASGHFVTPPGLVQPLGSFSQPLTYPLVRIADQLPYLREGADVWDLRKKNIQSRLFVINQCLVRFNLMWLRLNSSLHTCLTRFFLYLSALPSPGLGVQFPARLSL